jgi:hypothetical protein
VQKRLRPLANRAGVGQEIAAVAQPLLALTGQRQPAADPIKKPEAELLLKVLDLSGKGRLRNAQALCRTRYGPEFGNGHECSCLPQIHSPLYAESAYPPSANLYWIAGSASGYASAISASLGGFDESFPSRFS